MTLRAWTTSAVLVLCLGIIPGCGRQRMTPEAEVLLESGIVAYETHAPDRAIWDLDLFVLQYSRTDRVDEAYYYRGMAHLERGDMDWARQDFLRVLETTEDLDRRALTLVMLGDMAVSDGDMTTGEMRYRQALDDFRRSVSPRDEVLFKMGDLLQREGRFSESDMFFNQIIGDFPDSKYHQRATSRVHARRWTLWVGTYETNVRATEIATSIGPESRVALSREDGTVVFRVYVGAAPTHPEGVSLLEAYFDRFPAAELIVSR
jgi:tetratricopeptide (TPR) repeat protein